jgi:ribonucleoside-diphosphate reductase alpha chain
MDIYDKMCFTVSSAGGRRGAQMGTFDISHPDVLDFIRAKRENGRLRQFNLSLLITDEFIQAVKQGRPWPLAFPIRSDEADDFPHIDQHPDILWREWPVSDGMVVNAEGLVACRIYRTIPARKLWDVIMSATYDYAEPGFVLIDKVNEMNNNWFCEKIRATNPCGEQPLPPYGSCLLGSINLTKFVLDPFTERARFDWPRFREVGAGLHPHARQRRRDQRPAAAAAAHEIMHKRRHGMGYLGLGSTLAMLRMTYGRCAVGHLHRRGEPRAGDHRLARRARPGPREGAGADHG